MRQQILYILLFPTMFLLVPSCKDKSGIEKELGSLTGSVVDKYTSKNVKNAAVELLPIGLKAITGEDGYFEFPKVEEGTYELSVSKAGYKNYRSGKIQIKGNSYNKQVNVLLESLTTLRVQDNNDMEIDSVDFGSEYSDVVRTFNIANIGGNDLTWQITKTSNWITNIEPTKGTLKPGVVQPIVVTIDRTLLVDGSNQAKMYVSSNNGSKQLTVIAENLKAVATKEATDVLAFSAVLNAQVLRNLNPSIAEYGFVYSLLPAPSIVNGATKMSSFGSPKIGEYNMRVENLEREKKYYFRAFITNNKDTLYGEQKDFTTKVHTPEFTFITITSTATTITVKYKVSDAGLPLQEVGLCWSTNPMPSIGGNHKAFGASADTYTNTIDGLEIKTTYYIRAYAINEDGEHYSTVDKTILTGDGVPIVITNYPSERGGNYLDVSGVANTEIGTISHQGICYSKTPKVSINNSVVYAPLGSTTFQCKLEGLEQGTTYYYRAFAENEYGIGYGDELNETTYYIAGLTGYVYDNQGHPLPSALIEEGRHTTMTDANGYYEMSFTYSYSGKHIERFRASKNGYGEQILDVTLVSGQTIQQNFTLTAENSTSTQQETGSYVTLPDGSLMVQTVDKESAQWNSASSSCEASTMGGYTDWRLPTLTELKKIYTYRAQIGGFPSRTVTNNNYWSSTPGSKSGYYYYVNFNDGTSDALPRVNSFKVRAVRSVK